MRQTQCNVYRWGGEEFLLLFPGKAKRAAAVFAEDLRLRVAAHPFRLRDIEISLFHHHRPCRLC